MTIPGPLSPAVIAKLNKLFPDEQTRNQARALLGSYGTESWHREQDRVRLAILKLSEGNIESLIRCIEMSKRDYRDALARAEFPEQLASLHPDDGATARDLAQYKHWLNS